LSDGGYQKNDLRDRGIPMATTAIKVRLIRTEKAGEKRQASSFLPSAT
jgi:hypothetical protein